MLAPTQASTRRERMQSHAESRVSHKARERVRSNESSALLYNMASPPRSDARGMHRIRSNIAESVAHSALCPQAIRPQLIPTYKALPEMDSPRYVSVLHSVVLFTNAPRNKCTARIYTFQPFSNIDYRLHSFSHAIPHNTLNGRCASAAKEDSHSCRPHSGNVL